jgi:hypothetical protein
MDEFNASFEIVAPEQNSWYAVGREARAVSRHRPHRPAASAACRREGPATASDGQGAVAVRGQGRLAWTGGLRP